MDRNLDAIETVHVSEIHEQTAVLDLSDVQLALIGGGTGEVVFG